MTEAEFRQLVMTQRDRLHTYAAWSLGDLEAACDVSQEAFLRLWKHHRDVQPTGGRAWLFRAAHRLCIDRLRRWRGRGELPLDVLVDGPAAGAAVNGSDLKRVVSEGLARLSARDRALLVLREVVGMPTREIGRVLECSPGSVKVAVHRARERLRQELIKSRYEHDA